MYHNLPRTYKSLVVQVEYMGKKVTFAVEVQKHKNRIVIPKKKADELDLKPGDYLKITAEKITAEEWKMGVKY